MKLKLYKIFLVILFVFIGINIYFIIIKYTNSNLAEKENKKIVETFFREKSNDREINMKGYRVIGIVKISKIKIEYPILDIDNYNPEETKEPMKNSIVKYWGGNVNDFGNLSIAGHNNYNGTMFGKIKFLEKGDIIELTDLNNQTLKYFIENIFVTDPNDVTILQTEDKNVREVTLITCTNGNKQRLILKAREIL